MKVKHLFEVKHLEIDFKPVIPLHCQIDERWSSGKPNLTVPNMEDTVEKMLHRQRSGIDAIKQGNRNYPIDPVSLETAQDVVAKHVETLKQSLETTNQEVKALTKKQQIEAKRKQQEQEAFEAFKNEQQAKMREGK